MYFWKLIVKTLEYFFSVKHHILNGKISKGNINILLSISDNSSSAARLLCIISCRGKQVISGFFSHLLNRILVDNSILLRKPDRMKLMFNM